MRKVLCLLCTILLFTQIQKLNAQSVVVGSENFDRPVSFSVQQTTGATWAKDTSLYVSFPNSFRGMVPNTIGDSIILTSPIYDFTNYEFVQMSFSQICKISPSDIARVEYRLDAIGAYGQWQPIPVSSYKGNGVYSENGFNSLSYSSWGGYDSLSIPTQSWWTSETFNLTNEVGFARAQFRFVIKRGNTQGSNFSYGWLLDNIIFSASTYEIIPPTVEFLPPYPFGTAYSTGPFVINAKVKTNSYARINAPYLKYSSTINGITIRDSVLMKNIDGDSLWRATIPQYVYGTNVEYSITGSDTVGNNVTINAQYIISRPPAGGLNGYVYGGDTTTNTISSYTPYYYNNNYSWSKSIYKRTELSRTAEGGLITNIAYKVSSSSFNKNRQENVSIYMKATDDSTVVSTERTYTDPLTDGYSLVWSGTCEPNIGWWDLSLHNAFHLPAGKNLLVYVINNDGNKSNNNSVYFYVKSVSQTCYYQRSDTAYSTSITTGTRPIMRFKVTSSASDSSAVAVNEIVSPKQLENIYAGTPHPITITIKNKGINNLTSCRIAYSVNGVVQPDTLWTGNLLEDFNDTITIGNYIPTANGYDTIKVWAILPNGISDSTSIVDTLSTTIFGCNGPMNGVYYIGENSLYKTIDDAFFLLSTCGINGDIEFALESGRYEESWNFTDFGSAQLGKYKLTIRSAAMNADSVILVAQSAQGILIKNTENITFSHITIDCIEKNISKGVYFTGDATNVNISNCKILVDPTTSSNSYSPIYKASGTGILTNCRINNNIIDGGYYGIYMYAGTGQGAYGDILIDSNIVTNQYYYGIYMYYSNEKIHANTVTSRINNTTSYWYGIRSYYCNGSATCNRISTLKSFTYPYGMYIYYCGDSTDRFLMSNNEIYVNSTSSYYGAYLGYSVMDVVHNSILADGMSTRALYISNSSTAYSYTVLNNLLVARGQSGYPIYLSSSTAANLVPPVIDIDYNCYYSPQYIGYAGGNKTDLVAWTSTISTDIHSVNINPSYINSSINQKLSSYAGLDCPSTHNITSDIDGEHRYRTTAMGAYTKDLVGNDAGIIELLGWNPNAMAGDTLTIQAIIANCGNNPISSMDIDWEFNGIAQPTINYNSLLPVDEIDTITLGVITYIPKVNNLSVWITSVNNGIDSLNTNDSLSISNYICAGSLSGIVEIGPTREFTTINDALSIMSLCGVNGSFTIILDSGMYVEYVELNPIRGMTANDTLTITSASGNREDVYIYRAGDASQNRATITIGTNNIVLKDITITSQSLISTAYSYDKCITFSSNCNNIEIDNCYLRGLNFSSSVTGTNHVALINQGMTIDNLRIHDCEISGSSYAMYFQGANSTNVAIDNNIFNNADVAAIYCESTSFSSFTNNTAAQRVSSTVVPLDFTGIHLINCNGDVLNNKVTSVHSINGIYLSNFNANDSGIVANNEIYAIGGNGINVESSNVQILHNSILCSGDTSSNALYVGNNNTLTILNNNFVTKTSVPDYPIYVENASDITNMVIDYNNYYSQNGSYIAYIGNNINSLTTLRSITGQDLNSVIVNPMFQDETIDLSLLDSVGMSCPTLSNLTTDKKGVNRGTLTSIGAYHFGPLALDVALAQIVSPTDISTMGTQTDVKVRLYNGGLTTITNVTINWSINDVAQTPYLWTGNLTPRATSADITIGNFMPTQGDIEIIAFVSDPNGSADLNAINDTATISIYGCFSSMKGTYLIGESANAHFLDPNEAIKAMEFCGIDSAVRFEIEPGTYGFITMTSPIKGAANNSITFTSQTGNASDIVWYEINLGNLQNVTFTKMAFDGTIEDYHNIRFIKSCDNIEFSDCILIGDTLNDNSNVAAVSALCQQSGSGQLTNFRLLRNTIYGGKYALYFYGPSNAPNEILIEDNIIGGFCDYGVYGYYSNLTMKNNIITNRIKHNSSSTSLYGIYTYYADANIKENTLSLTSDVKTSVYGIYNYASSNNTTNTFNFLNNNVDLNIENGSSIYVLYSYYSATRNILNNTLRIKGSNSTLYGLYLYYGQNLTCNNNNIFVDTCEMGTFYGISTNNTTEYSTIDANKIWMNDTATNTGYGIYASSLGSNDIALSSISNNEIFMRLRPSSASSTSANIYLSTTKANVLHNSLKAIGGSTNRTSGIYNNSSSGTTLVIKNNNIDMGSNSDYPIYLNSNSNIGVGPDKIDVDYNNIISPTYTGYAAGGRLDMNSWKSIVKTDTHSIRIPQVYVDETKSLQVSNDSDYICPALLEVNTDILDYPRYGTTIMGAYGTTPPALDIALVSFCNIPEIKIKGNVIYPQIIIRNVGSGNITSATINYSFNGVDLTPINWTGNLARLEADTLILTDSCLLTLYINKLTAWMSLVNGTTTDSINVNDTINLEIFACDSVLNGTYVVGNGGDFETISDVVSTLSSCGINGDVTFEFLPEVHTGNLNLSKKIIGSDTYSIFFTKANKTSNNRAIIRPSSGSAITLKNQQNLYFDSLTIDASTGNATIGVDFLGECSNIAFTNCNILAKRSSTSTYYAIKKVSGRGLLDSLTINNCYIDGGYYGVYLYAGVSQSQCATISIENNIITSQYYYGLYLYYTDAEVNNNIISTYSSSSTSWYGIYSYYGHSNFRNNKVHSIARTLTAGYGMNIYYLNSSATSYVEITNNEIILKSTGANYGMYIGYPHKVNIIHNSIYQNATGAVRGLYLVNGSSTYQDNTIKNNNIVITSSDAGAYPIYFSSGTYIGPTYFKTDYNNYYSAGGSVAYIAVPITTLPALQTSTQGDMNSVIVNPVFVNPDIDLSLSQAVGLICSRDSKVTKDIQGTQREAMTVMGAYTLHVFSGMDLELTEIVEPYNATNSLCSPSYVSVKYAITNMGADAVDFSQDPMRLTIRTTGANIATIDTVISSGILNIFATDTFEVTDMLFVDNEGMYYLEASLSCANDTITENDTNYSSYNTHKISLPFDEDFSNTALTNLTNENLVGGNLWTVVAGNNNGYIDPFYGSGKLAFDAPIGSIGRLSTSQIQLNRTAQPTLEFWYAHDTSFATLNDQLNVTITFDGGVSHHNLMTLLRYSSSISTPSWTKYTIDLSPYIDSACAIIVFEAISYGGAPQYLDRISISSNSNISLTKAIAIDVDACNVTNRILGIEMTNQTGQTLDFYSNRTSIIVEVTGSTNQSFNYPLISGTLEGLAIDTFAITNSFNFLPGTYNIKAYISPSVDNTLADDTIYQTIVINPNLDINPLLVSSGTAMTNCLTSGASVYQDVIITNNGNLDMSDLELTLNVYNISGVLVQTITDSIQGLFAINQIDTHTFSSPYTVPNDEMYTIEVIANLICNPTFSFSNNIAECVDLNDIEIVAIISPDANNSTCSKVGGSQEIVVKVANNNPNEDVSAINIHAVISDGNSPITTISESIDNIPANDVVEYEFSRTFNVPNVNNYSVTVFVDRYDANAQNDTLSISKCTDLGISETSANEINMSQNMPNPANDIAKVNYTIPSQGKVVFTIASVTGQILHTQEIEAEAGIHSIEFNTANLASGIYFYTMDFNGQRLTKKMTIRK